MVLSDTAVDKPQLRLPLSPPPTFAQVWSSGVIFEPQRTGQGAPLPQQQQPPSSSSASASSNAVASSVASASAAASTTTTKRYWHIANHLYDLEPFLGTLQTLFMCSFLCFSILHVIEQAAGKKNAKNVTVNPNSEIHQTCTRAAASSCCLRATVSRTAPLPLRRTTLTLTTYVPCVRTAACALHFGNDSLIGFSAPLASPPRCWYFLCLLCNIVLLPQGDVFELAFLLCTAFF